MKEFRAFVRQLLLVWLVIYGVALLIAVAQPLTFFMIGAFDFAPTYYHQLVDTLRVAAWWLIPTGFLILANALSSSNWKAQG